MDRWQIGKVKFFSKKKNFGFVYDNTYVHLAKNEYYYDSQVCEGLLFKTDDIVFFKTKLVGNKTKVCQIKLLDKNFYESNIDEFDLDLKIHCFKFIEDSYNQDIDDICKNFDGEIKELKQLGFFEVEELDITNYLDEFDIKLSINYKSKVGDEDYLHIYYSIIHPLFENVSIPEFNNTIIWERGIRDLYPMKEDFIKNRQFGYEKLIPKMLEELKKHLCENYIILKGKKFTGFFELSFKDKIRRSIQYYGLRKTKESQNLIFRDFCKAVKNGVGFKDFIHLKRINLEKPVVNFGYFK
ncbi:hypothetical protein [Euzebyella saccharophila]|uniref:CSD domain-containing protein n=1 Tax=Euzebyella saccharophila TaxID=679664 RepID=A0ABV8JJW6_9FLAO|nr:hypothetical protein [Euzebyella saccharophila]